MAKTQPVRAIQSALNLGTVLTFACDSQAPAVGESINAARAADATREVVDR